MFSDTSSSSAAAAPSVSVNRSTDSLGPPNPAVVRSLALDWLERLCPSEDSAEDWMEMEIVCPEGVWCLAALPETDGEFLESPVVHHGPLSTRLIAELDTVESSDQLQRLQLADIACHLQAALDRVAPWWWSTGTSRVRDLHVSAAALDVGTNTAYDGLLTETGRLTVRRTLLGGEPGQVVDLDTLPQGLVWSCQLHAYAHTRESSQ